MGEDKKKLFMKRNTYHQPVSDAQFCTVTPQHHDISPEKKRRTFSRVTLTRRWFLLQFAHAPPNSLILAVFHFSMLERCRFGAGVSTSCPETASQTE